MDALDWLIDHLLDVAIWIECRLRGHGPVVTRLTGVELSAPTCLACGKRFPVPAVLP